MAGIRGLETRLFQWPGYLPRRVFGGSRWPLSPRPPCGLGQALHVQGGRPLPVSGAARSSHAPETVIGCPIAGLPSAGLRPATLHSRRVLRTPYRIRHGAFAPCRAATATALSAPVAARRAILTGTVAAAPYAEASRRKACHTPSSLRKLAAVACGTPAAVFMSPVWQPRRFAPSACHHHRFAVGGSRDACRHSPPPLPATHSTPPCNTATPIIPSHTQLTPVPTTTSFNRGG